MRKNILNTNALICLAGAVISLTAAVVTLQTVFRNALKNDLEAVLAFFREVPGRLNSDAAIAKVDEVIRSTGDRMLLILVLTTAIGVTVSLLLQIFSARRTVDALSAPMTNLLRSAELITATVTDKLTEEGGLKVFSEADEHSRPEPVGYANGHRNLEQIGATINQMNQRLSATNRHLTQRNEQLRVVLQNLKDGIIVIRADGRVVLLTRRVVNLLGPKSNSAYLQTLGSNYAQMYQLVKEIDRIGGEQGRRLELRYPQERVLDVDVTAFGEEPEVQAYLLVISDVTRMVKLEQLRADFVSNVTHELKTPLTSIQGYLELLKSLPRDEETRNQFYEIIEIEVDRLKSLIADLLSLSEIEAKEKRADLRTERVYLYEVADQTVARLHPLAEQKSVRVHNDIPPDLVYLCNTARMTQLFTNLIHNAIVYNRPEGGEVWIRGDIRRDRLELVVQDNGIGISKEDQERIFERFYRVHKERSRVLGGTGLGLSIVKHLVNLYDGIITMDSEEGVGTTMRIVLPLNSDTSADR